MLFLPCILKNNEKRFRWDVSDSASMKPEPVIEYVITPHGAFEINRRGITEEMVRQILNRPEQRLDVRPGRVVLQSQIIGERPEKTLLLRVFVDIDRRPAEVVTAYLTSKVSKYWRDTP